MGPFFASVLAASGLRLNAGAFRWHNVPRGLTLARKKKSRRDVPIRQWHPRPAAPETNFYGPFAETDRYERVGHDFVLFCQPKS
jgi:hypothetical protein